jgi:hypothetical protein
MGYTNTIELTRLKCYVCCMRSSVKHQETIDYFLKIVWQTVANRYNQLVTEFGITQSIGYLLINIDEEGTTVSQAAAFAWA